MPSIFRTVRRQINDATNAAAAGIDRGFSQIQEGQDILREQSQIASEAVSGGVEQARTDVSTGAQQAREDLTGGFSAALDAILGAQQEGVAGRELVQNQIGLGQAAQSQLGALLGLSGDPSAALSTLQGTPGFQFRLDLGRQAIERSNAARGLLSSGNTLIGLTEFGQGLAAEAFNNQVGQLANLIGTSLSASESQQARATNFAANIANLQTGQGSALANIAASTGSQLGGLAQQGAFAQADIAQALGGQLFASQQDLASLLAQRGRIEAEGLLKQADIRLLPSLLARGQSGSVTGGTIGGAGNFANASGTGFNFDLQNGFTPVTAQPV